MAPRVSPLHLLGNVGLLLFGLTFLGAGLAAGYFFALTDTITAINARSYVPVPAEILNVELKRHHGKNSNTYETKARYRYTVGDNSYTSERVAISSGADNIGDYQQDLYERLNTARLRRTPVTAWVNPNNPSEALLDRDMRW